MQDYQLQIRANKNPVIMERVLQVTRYRGFELCGLSMLENEEDNTLLIELSLKGDKSIENLQHQLLKIFDITQIKVEDQEHQKITA